MNDWDYENSTYAWKLELDPAHEKNNPEKPYLLGYSKKIGNDENRNKLDLLKVKLVMLHRHNWFDKTKYIVVFKSASPLGFMDKKAIYPILILFKTDYEIKESYVTGDREQRDFWDNMIAFLKKFYEALREGKSTQHLLPSRRYDYSKDTYLDVAKWNFKGRKQLYEHCSKAVKHGIPYEAVEAFKLKYEEMKPFQEKEIEPAFGKNIYTERQEKYSSSFQDLQKLIAESMIKKHDVKK